MPRKRVIDDQGRRVWARSNPVARANAKPKRSYITHGGKSNILSEPLDSRTVIGRAYKAGLRELRAHAGGTDITAVQSRMIDQTVRLGILADLSWAELLRSGPVVDGNPAPAATIFLNTSRQYRDSLVQLGVEKRRKVIKLTDYL